MRDQIVGVRRIEEALQRQVVHGGDLETNLLELGAVSEDVLAQYRSQVEGLGFVPAGEVMHPDSEAAELLTPELAERHRMIPLRIEGTRLLVAVASPPPEGTLDELSFLLSLDFVPRITTELRIAAALAHVFGIPMAPRFARLSEKLGPVPFEGVARAQVVSVSGSPEPPNKADDRVVALVGGKRPTERLSPVPEPRLVIESATPPREEETERVFTPVPRQQPTPRRRRKVGPTVAGELLEAARTRDEVLEILLEVAHQTLDYVAVFALQEGSADGRAAMGDGTTTEHLRAISIPLDEPSFLRTVRESRSHYLGPIHDEDSNHGILRKLGRAPPANAMVMPIALRSRVVLLVYGDNGRRPTTGEDIVDLLALAPRVAAAFQRLILERKFTGYAKGEAPPETRQVPPRGEIVPKRPSLAAGPDDAPATPPIELRDRVAPPATPLPVRSQQHTMKVGVPPDPTERPAAAPQSRAPDTLQGIPAVRDADEARGPVATIQMSFPPDAREIGESPPQAVTMGVVVVPRASDTLQGIPAHRDADETRGPVETVQISVPPDAREAETAPLATDGSADEVAEGNTTLPAPAPVMEPAPVETAPVAETAPLPVEPAGPVATRSRDVAAGLATLGVSATTGSAAIASTDAPASGASPTGGVPPSEVDTGPIAKGDAQSEKPAATSEADTAPLRTAATARPAAAPTEAPEIPDTSEIPTGEEGDGDEPELTVSPWNVGGGDETFTPVPRAADTIGEHGWDPSTRPTDPAPEPEEQPVQPPELGPISGSSAGRRRVHHDAFRVDVLTPLPVPDKPVPSVIVDMGPNIESLVDSLERGGEEGDLAAAALQKIGEAAIPALVQRFPGPLGFDRHSQHTRLPRVGECGPVLRLLPGFRQHAVPYLLPLLASPAPEVRFYATFLFSELQYPEAIPNLAPLLWDPDQQTRILAIDVLKGFRRFPEFAALTKELRKAAWDASLPPAKRRVAVEAIGELRDAGAVALLVELLGHEDAQLSELCWRSLVLITRQDFGQTKKKWQHWLQKEGSRHHVEWLIDALVHPSPELRLGASEELKRITKEYFGYYYNLPRRDREKARKRYLEWWDRIGRARFTGQRL
ncbi:MAG: hypothetical protein HYY06_29040 [Deltaproteobacteria bacterium]|nr:hypothetical protein [Deltaproteobacteria bacterium]